MSQAKGNDPAPKEPDKSAKRKSIAKETATAPIAAGESAKRKSQAKASTPSAETSGKLKAKGEPLSDAEKKGTMMHI